MNYVPPKIKGLLSNALNRIRGRAGAALALSAPAGADELARLCDVLLSRSGEPSATATASELLAAYARANADERNRFFAILAERYNADPDWLDKAIANYQAQRDAASMAEVHAASESKRQQLIHGLNQAPGGTLMLLRMREHGLANKAAIPGYDLLDGDFREVLASWFNRGFLTLKRIEWSSPANILRKIIEYEAVHEIKDWEDLRRRLEPPDRRCYAFFHPQIPEEPLIFVEVALTAGIPSSIQTLLDDKRQAITASAATTAVFYSISNCQDGLRGVPFGNFLIKQVAETLKAELPSLKAFVTLSPIPNFAGWLERERKASPPQVLAPEQVSALEPLGRDGWQSDETLKSVLMSAAARYLLNARGRDKRPYDSVAKFHLGNGAELAMMHWMADTSPKGLKQSYGLMVNYLYDLKHIEENQALLAAGEVSASTAVHRLARIEAPARERLLSAFWRSTGEAGEA